MKGTLVSILIGALAGVLLTVASSVHASRVASRAKHVSVDSAAPERLAPGAAPGSPVETSQPVEKSSPR